MFSKQNVCSKWKGEKKEGREKNSAVFINSEHSFGLPHIKEPLSYPLYPPCQPVHSLVPAVDSTNPPVAAALI